jgi:hypothetical protein
LRNGFFQVKNGFFNCFVGHFNVLTFCFQLPQRVKVCIDFVLDATVLLQVQKNCKQSF